MGSHEFDEGRDPVLQTENQTMVLAVAVNGTGHEPLTAMPSSSGSVTTTTARASEPLALPEIRRAWHGPARTGR